MASTFNPQILADKLSKLNSTQQSIETLSHWCIFHMNKAKQVVETWDRQFRSAPREQRLAFLYLANDILQNSRRKGAEFVTEFWKVLPDSLRDVIVKGDEVGRNAALRLISIWDERKVFGSRGQMLKEEFLKWQVDNGNKNLKPAALKMRSSGGNTFDKLVSAYQAVYSSQLDEDATFCRCKSAIGFIEKVGKGAEGDYRLDGANTDELKGQHAILRSCIEQLAAVESSRANLVSVLQEALQEQVHKLDQVRDQLQAAQAHSEPAASICRQIVVGNGNVQVVAEQSGNGAPDTQSPHNFVPGSVDQSVTYTRQLTEDPKSAAAAVAAKLAASTSSAEMLTFVLSSLASEGVIGNSAKESSPPEKRAKIENNEHHHPSYFPQNPQPPPATVTSDDEFDPEEPPPPPTSPPPLPPLPPPMQPYQVPQYMQTAMPMLGGPYSYNVGQQPETQPGYAPVGPPGTGVSAFAPSSNSYQSYPPEGGFYGQPSSLPMAPMSRQ